MTEVAEVIKVKIEPIARPEEEELDNGNCLFCMEQLKPVDGNGNTFGTTTTAFALPGSEENTLVNQQLWAVFVLRQLLKFSRKKVASLLQKSGGVSPSEWFRFCTDCQRTVNQSMETYAEILKAVEQFKKFRSLVVNKIRESEDDHDENSPPVNDDTRIVSISNEIRRTFKETVNPVANQLSSPQIKAEVETWKDYSLQDTILENNEMDVDPVEADLDMTEDDDADENDNLNDPLYIPEETEDSMKNNRKGRKQQIIPREELEYPEPPSEFTITTNSLQAIETGKKKKRLTARRLRVIELVDKHFKDGTYNCPECPAKYPIRRKFQRHLTLHQRKGSYYVNFKCEVCNYVTANTGGLRKHLFKQHNLVIRCEICQKHFSFQGALDKHRKLKHRNQTEDADVSKNEITTEPNPAMEQQPEIQPPKHKCDLCLCKRLFSSEKGLQNHLSKHKSFKETSCPKCNYPCASTSALEAHLAKNLCNRKFEYNCEQCQFKTFRLYLFEAHMQMHKCEKEVDQGRDPVCNPLKKVDTCHKYKHKCKLCDFQADKRQAFRVHKRTVHPEYNLKINVQIRGTERKVYKCTQCPFQSNCNTNFDNHMQMHKTFEMGENENGIWRCTLCQFECEGRINFGIHMREKHGSELGIQSYICDQCNKSYAREYNLKSHIAEVHTKQCKYFCEICGFGTIKQSTLNIHMKSHSSEKPIICDLCGAAFKANTGLYQHMKKVHQNASKNGRQTEQKCNTCSATFVVRSLLLEHMRTSHPELYVHKCEECGNHYRTVGCLQQHQKLSHTGSGPVECQFCNTKVKSKIYLSTHYKKYCKRKP